MPRWRQNERTGELLIGCRRRWWVAEPKKIPRRYHTYRATVHIHQKSRGVRKMWKAQKWCASKTKTKNEAKNKATLMFKKQPWCEKLADCCVWKASESCQSWKNLKFVLTVGNKKLPQLPLVRGGKSGSEQQERMHVTERQWEWWRLE